eukprot:6604010-Pyramimonas_sp.AAC.1
MREPHVKRHQPLIREVLTHVYNECARRPGQSHILKTTRPQSVKLSHMLITNVRGAQARATFSKPPALKPC